MGALADNKFNRILDNDLSESVNVILLIIQHFRAKKYVKRKRSSRNHKKFMKNIFSSIKLPKDFFFIFQSSSCSLGLKGRERVYVD